MWCSAIQAENRNTVPPPRAHRTRAAEVSVARHYRVASYAAGQARAMQVLVENASNTFGIALVPGYDAALPSAAMAAWAAGRPARAGGAAAVRRALRRVPRTGRPAIARLAAGPGPGDRSGARRAALPAAVTRCRALYLAGRAAELRPDPPAGSLDPAAWDPLFAPEVLDGSLAYLAPGPGVTALDGPVRACRHLPVRPVPGAPDRGDLPGRS